METKLKNQNKEVRMDKPKNEDVKREGFSAEELAEESSYSDATEIAQMMRRGDESIPDPNERDIVGTSDKATDTENQPFPEHQNSKTDLIENDRN